MDNDGVIVVGAGPAGAATALRLARASIPVTIVERARFPRQKVCGEYLGTGAVAALDALGLGERIRAHAAPLRGIKIFTGATRLELAFPRPALALAREKLDALILDAACEAGAKLITGRAEDVLFGDSGRVCGVVVRDGSGERVRTEGRFLVGADGTGSIVARKLGLSRPPPSVPRFAVGGHFRGIDVTDCVEMFCDAKTYLAINPLGDGLANVMAVVPKNKLENWSRILDLAAAARSGPRVAIGPLVHSVRRSIAPGAILAGDAAGFLSPFTGQGVYLALLSAERAAAALCAAFASPRLELQAFTEYDRVHQRELRQRGYLSVLVDTLVAVPMLARRAARRLENSPALAAIVLDAIAGSAPPNAALRPAVLRRLLA